MSERDPQHRRRLAKRNCLETVFQLERPAKKPHISLEEHSQETRPALSAEQISMSQLNLQGATSPYENPIISPSTYHTVYNGKPTGHSGTKRRLGSDVNHTVDIPTLDAESLTMQYIPPMSYNLATKGSRHHLQPDYQTNLSGLKYLSRGSQSYLGISSQETLPSGMDPATIQDSQNNAIRAPAPSVQHARLQSSYKEPSIELPQASVAVELLAGSQVWKSFLAEMNQGFTYTVIHPYCLKELQLEAKEFPVEGYVPPFQSPIGLVDSSRYVEIVIQLRIPRITAQTITVLVLPDDHPYHGGICLYLGSKFIDKFEMGPWLQYRYNHDQTASQCKAASTLPFGESFADGTSFGAAHANMAEVPYIFQMSSPGHQYPLACQNPCLKIPKVLEKDFGLPLLMDGAADSATSPSRSAMLSPRMFSPFSNHPLPSQNFSSPLTIRSSDANSQMPNITPPIRSPVALAKEPILQDSIYTISDFLGPQSSLPVFD